MRDDLTINSRITIPASELTIELSRSGGPGGQHVNKTETRVRLRFDVRQSAVLSVAQKERICRCYPSQVTSDGVLMVVCDQYRSQHRNLETARARMVELIQNGIKVAKRRKKTRPTRASRERRLDGKRRRGQIKDSRKKIRRDD